MKHSLSGRPALNSSHKQHTMSETEITRQIMDYLRLRGAFAVKILGHLGQQRGLPDISAVVRGRAVWIEVKVPQPLNTSKQIAGFLNEKQRGQLLAIAQAGGMALVVTDVMDVMRAFEERVQG